jgi:hypothetical protein
MLEATATMSAPLRNTADVVTVVVPVLVFEVVSCIDKAKLTSR